MSKTEETRMLLNAILVDELQCVCEDCKSYAWDLLIEREGR
jgi:hypothetical protein